MLVPAQLAGKTLQPFMELQARAGRIS